MAFVALQLTLPPAFAASLLFFAALSCSAKKPAYGILPPAFAASLLTPSGRNHSAPAYL
jgi:hypothetical protein